MRARLLPLWFAAFTSANGVAIASAPFAPLLNDPEPILRALAKATPLDLGDAAVTGLVVPHHRVASDLIATGWLTAARGARPDRIILLTPDHFKRSARPFATTLRDFATMFGVVPTDRTGAKALLRSPDVGTSILFEREHGVGELLPYAARLFPGVPVLPVAVAIGSTRAQWERLTQRLLPLVSSRTLIVQSTDFSHYLTREQAVRRDQQMLNVIAAGDLDALARALQPQHLDSRGSQYIHQRLQWLRFGARPIVFGNYNSADHGATSADETTSYVAQVFAPGAQQRIVYPAGRHRTVCLAGDAFFGRNVARFLADADVRARVQASLAQRLQGCPLVVNLEGVLTADTEAAGPMQLAMPRDDTLAWLRALGVVAVSVANNHSRDLGEAAYEASAAALRDAGIQVIEHGRTAEVGPLRITALTDLDNTPRVRRGLVSGRELESLRAQPDEPHVAFLHWGREFVAEPGPRERALADALRERGFPIVVGAHSHRASKAPELLGELDGLLVPSLGNFVFDQRAPRASGAILQVSVFEQRTWALRLVPLPDLWTLGRRTNGPPQ